MSHPILLYDGVCGFCNGVVQFILRRDRAAVFCFAALQSPFAARILTRHSLNPGDLDTVYVVINYEESSESVLARSDAIVFVLRQLGGIWKFLGFILGLVPRVIRRWGYDFVARNRYRIFGRYDSCPLPTAETRSRFLDLEP
jgi:predicted DCC family thiol-disulfide oxidoreductase YuxK